MTSASPRYAIYVVPDDDSALGRFGKSVLGEDATLVADEGQRAAWLAATGEPRRYGFHATVKAPFHLAPGASLDALSGALRAFTSERPPVPVGRLAVRRIGHFLALTPVEPLPMLSGFAAEVVAAFEPFRAPLSLEDTQRRLAAGLTRTQQAMLARWGYPYVFAEFRFHMTLSGRLDNATSAWMQEVLTLAYAPQSHDAHEITALALMEQPVRDAPFRLLERFALKGSTDGDAG
jgi:hypothetical protein